MLYEYSLAILFYAVFSSFSVIGLALISRRISNFKTAYIASKPLGLLIFGYFVWLLSSLKLLDFQNTLFLYFLLLAGIAGSLFYLTKNWPNPPAGGWRGAMREALVIESFWLVLYLAYLWLRSYNAEIHGTERFMDMAFFNASYKTNYFPPIDPWRAGSPINYYYYGHYLFSLISKLSGILPKFGYTFTLGLLFSSSIMLAWGFVRRFTNSNLFAILAGYFIVISGTVAYSFCVLGSSLNAICSYMKSTRLYEPSYIINEIPSYSFTVGDLHAHLIALPFFILALILIYDFFRSTELRYDLIFALTICIASLGLINPWDFVTISIIISLALLFKIIRGEPPYKILLRTAAIGFCAVILMLPFLFYFESGAAGIGFAPLYAKNNLLVSKQYPTPIHGWLGMWGGFLLISILSVLKLRKKVWNTTNFAIVSVLGAALLLLLVELFFVRDLYSLANPPYFRANTVFKFGFHTWTLLVLDSMILAAQTLEKKNTLFLTASIIIVAILGSFYPYQASKQFYFSASPPYSLDGELFLNKFYRDDYAAIQWIKNNIKNREVIVEAAGESYSDYGRISVFTGMINPINWLSHEWTWHFKPEIKNAKPGTHVESGWGLVSKTSGEVRQIYESQNILITISFLKKFNAKYIYIGGLERKEYPLLNEQKISALGTVVFSSGNSKLYKLNKLP